MTITIVIFIGGYIGTITPNCGASALRNGIKIIEKHDKQKQARTTMRIWQNKLRSN